MNRNVSAAAKLLGVDAAQVKRWASLFKEYLGPGASPVKGKARSFSDGDILVLSYVSYYWENDPDLEAIRIGLNCEHHFEDAFVQNLYLHTPLLQEPPDDLDETWRHGILLAYGTRYQYLELARSYRNIAESLLRSALDEDDLAGRAYPNWWGTMPMAVFTFLEAYDFTGKTIIPFCTHEGSGMGRSEDDIRQLCPIATVRQGLAIRGGNVQRAGDEIAAWLCKVTA